MYFNQRQMNLSDKIAIEAGLYSGKSFKDIAKKINRHPATIAREVKNNRKHVQGSFFLGNDCKYVRKCTMQHLCDDNCKGKCFQCRNQKCYLICSKYQPRHCSKVDLPPYVCNNCEFKRDCQQNRYFYSAKLADATATRRRSVSRSGIRLSDEKITELDKTISPLIKKGQPLTHIYAEHSDQIPVSIRSLYNYIDAGVMSVRNIDLRRKTSYRLKKKNKNATTPEIRKSKEGRKYEDFQKYMLDHPKLSVVQMDTVSGSRKGGQRIMTMLFESNNVMLLFLIPDGKANSIINVFDFLTNTLGLDVFRRLFPVILTDNGSEFSKILKMETTESGKTRYKVFFCDPQASWQKAELEKNHEFIRYVIPKGQSLNGFDAEDIQKLMNHINSIKRLGLGHKSPYDLIQPNDKDMKLLMNILGMDIIPADDVHLKPALLKK